MLHPSTQVQYINPIIGHGVFATSHIPKGTILWVRDELDQEITPEKMEKMNEAVREVLLTYSYRNNKGNFIFCWDNTKYVNHSNHPNCMTTPYGFEIAIKEIHEGDEITNDYGSLNIIDSFEPYDEGHDRKVIHPNDIATFHQKWDQIIDQCINEINNVEQPLMDAFDPEQWKKIQLIIAGSEKRTSILTCLLIEN